MPNSSTKSYKRKALGKGLGAILPTPKAGGRTLLEIPVDRIDPNPVQPRSSFDEASLRGLATSIKADGVLQPILVRAARGRYGLVVGERRVQACRLAGLHTIPAIVRDIDPDKLLEVTLVENIQREDLNPIEIALALERMQAELGLIHEELAARTGMSRTSITNHLRLLRLPPAVKDLVQAKQIQMGHARALLPLKNPTDQESLAERAAAEGLSVRDVERMVRRLLKPSKRRAEPQLDPNVADAIDKLERFLQAPVRLRQRGRKGRLEITFSSPEQLAAIYDRIVGDAV